MDSTHTITEELQQRFGAGSLVVQETRDGIPTLWVSAQLLLPVLMWRSIKKPIVFFYFKRKYTSIYVLSNQDKRVYNYSLHKW